jgi:hypothetical protein
MSIALEGIVKYLSVGLF